MLCISEAIDYAGFSHLCVNVRLGQAEKIFEGSIRMEENPNNCSAEDSALMTLSQLAVYLQVSPRTVMSLARNGKIPCHKVGSLFRFHRSAVLHALLLHPTALSIPDEPIPSKPVEIVVVRRGRLGVPLGPRRSIPPI